ncbi:MAG: STT3 domain-containing protein [Sulfolobales archaeon]
MGRKVQRENRRIMKERIPAEALISRGVQRIGFIVALTLLVFIGSLGVYLRILPLANSLSLGYTPYLDELDPYSNYYVVKYMLEHGPLSFWDLKPPNPAATLFWYPWGRDFPATDVPGIYYTIYFLYIPFSGVMDLMSFMFLLPVVASAIAFIGVFLTAREISRSNIAAVITTGLLATFFMDRTVAGFIVKYTIAIMTLPWITYFFIKAFNYRKSIYFIVTGLLLAYSAYSTGLFVAPYLSIYATMVLSPLVYRKESPLRMIMELVYISAPLILVFISTPIYGIDYITRNLGIIPIASILAIGLYGLYQKITPKNSLKIYIASIVGVIAIGLLAIFTGFISLAGKAAQALGIYHVLGTLSFTIAEYQPTNMGYVLNVYGTVVILSIFSLLYGFYLVLSRRDLTAFYLSILNIAILYVLSNLSYFISYAVVSMTMIASLFIGFLVKNSSQIFTRIRRYVSFSSVFSLLLLIAVLLSHVYIVYSYHIPAYRSHLPMILTSGISMSAPSDAWLRALEWIRTQTPKDSVIMAWWDYGYWITPLGERASVADGSTINATQIEILAKILSADNETEAVRLMREYLHLQPNKTYVLVYDAFLVNTFGEYIVPLNWADAAKGISAILRIAGVNIDYDIYGNNTPSYYTIGSGPQKYVRVVVQPGGFYTIKPNWASPNISNTLLYGIMIDGMLRLFPGYSFYSDDPANGGTPVERPTFSHFQPAAIIPSYIPINVGGYYTAYVVIFIYKFTG